MQASKSYTQDCKSFVLRRDTNSFLILVINFYVSAFDGTLSVKNLYNATSEISDKWLSLGIQLDMEPHILRSIQSRNSLSQDECRQEMFEVWLHSDLDASWEKLLVALGTLKYHRLAQSVKIRYADIYMKQCGMSSSFAVIWCNCNDVELHPKILTEPI